jgi:hypothetical protein
MNAFQKACQEAAAAKDEDTVFGITIPSFARDIARQNRLETVEPTLNTTTAVR